MTPTTTTTTTDQLAGWLAEVADACQDYSRLPTTKLPADACQVSRATADQLASALATTSRHASELPDLVTDLPACPAASQVELLLAELTELADRCRQFGMPFAANELAELAANRPAAWLTCPA